MLAAVMLPNSNSVIDAEDARAVSDQPCAEYLLVCQASAASLCEGTWSFTLETADGEPVFSAEDVDIGDLNRLTLLAAVRGLESIDGPSSVLLLSNNRYLIRSLAESLPRWRENHFVWEHFGRRMEVQHADLWRRIDRALRIHRVRACLISSRLVSGGSGPWAGRYLREDATRAESGRATSTAPQDRDRLVRVDSPHRGVPTPASQRVPRDGLRRWLLSDAAGPESRAPRHRFTAADLVEST